MSKAGRAAYLMIILGLLLISCGIGQPEVVEETPTSAPTEVIPTPTPTPTEPAEYPQPEEPPGYPGPVFVPTPYPQPGDPAYPYPVVSPYYDPAYPGPGVQPTQPAGEGAYPGPAEPVVSTPAVVGTPGTTPGTAPGTPQEITPTPFERPPGTPMPPPGRETVTISIWHSWSSTEVQVLDPILRAFQSAYPDVYFNVTYYPRETLQRRYDTSAYLGGGPSLLFGPSEWGQNYYEQDLVVDISGLATEDFLARINPAAVDQGRMGDALISLPYSIRQGVVMYRNKQIIESAPATFEELVQSARAVTRGGVVGAYLERSYFYSAAHLYGLGGSLMDEQGYPAFNTRQGEDWMNLLDSYAQAGPFEFNGTRDRDTFKAGKAGIIIDGSWHRAALAEAIGADNLVVDPWPSHGSGHLSGFIRTDNVYLNANLSDQERYQPLLFMAFMLTPEVQSLLSQVGIIPVISDASVDDQLIQQMVIAFERATSFPTIRQAGAYWDPLEAAMLRVFSSSASPAQALRDAEVEIREALQSLSP
jgi:arabinogalactan oligomer / maltooligosaccharide transport system substrate-binding protein